MFHELSRIFIMEYNSTFKYEAVNYKEEEKPSNIKNSILIFTEMVITEFLLFVLTANL